MAGKRPRRHFKEKGERPSLDYLSKGVEFANEAKRKQKNYRLLIDQEFMEQEVSYQSLTKKKKLIKIL
jgi:hypothetical protein